VEQHQAATAIAARVDIDAGRALLAALGVDDEASSLRSHLGVMGT
jgi:hypothetical protein